MKRSFALVWVCTLAGILTVASCTTVAPEDSMLTSRLAPGWIAGARHLRSGDRTIYYHGHARGDSVAGKNWTGTVQGEVLVLDPAMAIVIPSGEFTLTPTGGVRIIGQHRVLTAETPAWKHLLLP